MEITEMLAPGAYVETSRANMTRLIDGARKMQQAGDAEALAFYQFVTALVLHAGGEVHLTPEVLESAKAHQMEVADLPDGGQIVRVEKGACDA